MLSEQYLTQNSKLILQRQLQENNNLAIYFPRKQWAYVYCFLVCWVPSFRVLGKIFSTLLNNCLLFQILQFKTQISCFSTLMLLPHQYIKIFAFLRLLFSLFVSMGIFQKLSSPREQRRTSVEDTSLVLSKSVMTKRINMNCIRN